MGMFNREVIFSNVKKIVPDSVKNKIKKKYVIHYSANKEYQLLVSEKPALQGKIAVVIGGNGAIGRAVCIRLAVEGAKVYCAGRNQETIEGVVNEIQNLGFCATPMVIDTTDKESVEKVFDALCEVETIDILVYCAGGSARNKMTTLAQQDTDVIESVLSTNLNGAILCTRKTAKKMMEQRSGKIVLISSSIGIGGKAKCSEYGAAKAGVIGFVKSMALELGEYGINVNCVSPGYIQRGEFTNEKAEWLKSTNCLHKVGTLEDIASAVFFMCGKESDFITGQNLIVDGGRTLGLYGDI